MREEIFKALEARWHELYDLYEAVKSALPPVVRWEWATGSRYNPTPHYFKRNPPRGRVLKSPEAANQRDYSYEYGFDIRGKVIVERYHNNKFSMETFHNYSPNQIESTTFFQYKSRRLLKSIAWAELRSRRIQHYARLTLDYSYGDETAPYPAPFQTQRYMGGATDNATAEDTWARLSTQKHAINWAYQDYQYEGKRLIRIQNEIIGAFSDTWTGEDKLDYDELGKLERITRTIPLKKITHRFIVYRKRKPGETLTSLTGHAKAKLIETIPHLVAAQNFDEPLYCLNLYYYRARRGDYFPPQLLPGLERDRQRKLKDHGSENAAPYIWWYLWEYDDDDNELSPRLHVTDPETLESCERLDTEINMRSKSDHAERVLYGICRELNQLDWSQYAPVTPDFIVYACDQTEHTYMDDSLRLSGASKKQIDDWYDRGLL